MKKIGPLSIDLVVGCTIYDIRRKKGNEQVEFNEIVERLNRVVSKTSILRALNTLSQWGIVKTVYGETQSGRAGRLYSVSGESEVMIRATYEDFWPKVEKIIEEKQHR